jgi:MYXO-CTERM domain-containing protein
MAGFSVCIAGTNSCTMNPDAGPTEDSPAPDDADADVRDTSLPPVDLGPSPDTGPTMEPPIAEMSGCGCRAVGNGPTPLVFMAFGGFLVLGARRRRRTLR